MATPEPVPSRRFALEKLNEEGLWEHISQSNWVGAPCPLTTLQRTLQEGLERHCPKAHPCAHANPQWPPRASELLAGARRARRRYITSKEEHDQVSYQSFQGLLKKELCRVGRANWRRFIEESTSAPDNPHEKGLWRLSRWSKLRAGKPQASPHIPPLRRTDQEVSDNNNSVKAQILAEKFFSEGGQADLSDTTETPSPPGLLNIPSAVTAEQVKQAMHRLPNGKRRGQTASPMRYSR